MAKKKTKKFNINERLKKDPINSDWLRNAGKSLGVTSFDIVKEMFPATTDFAEYNADDVRDVIASLRQNVGSKRMLIQQIKNLPHMKIASDALKNAKDDLKSGNFNNKNRFGDEFDFGFDDSDIFGDDDDFDFDIDTDPTDDGDDNKPSTPTTIINTMPLAKAMNNNTQMTVNTMVSIADQQMAMQSEKMAFDHSVSNSLISGLGSINDNLSLLVQFNADSTSKYHAASMKYYEESIEYLKYLDAKNKKDDADKKKRSFIDGLFTAEGGLKLGSYGQRIMKNLEDMKDENVIVSSIFDMLKDTDTLKMLASNPLGEITSMMIKKFIPAATKKILGDLDTSLNSFMPAILSRINTFEDSDNQILNYIYKVFGSKEKLKYDVYLGDYEKGAISWDGESKKALVEVIPTYLRRIESALTGNDERIYNYDKGVFVSREDLEKEIDKSISKAEISGYSESKARAREYANKLGMGIEEKEQFFTDFEEYLRKSTQKGNRISPIRQRTKDGEIIDDFATENLFDGDRDRQKFMREFLTKGMPVSQFIKMVTSELSDSRSRTARVLQKINDNPTLSGYSALYNDLSGNDYNGSLLARQQEDLVRMLDSRVDEFGYKEIDYLREIKTTLYDELTGIHRVLNTSGIVNASDGFGLKPYDYLRDIRSVLVNGIKVFPDKMKRYHGWRPNGDIQDRIKREENDMVARLEALSNQTENITNETNTLSNIINENEKRINEISNNNQGKQSRINAQINRNNNTKNILGINTKAGSEADEELEDYEIEEQRKEKFNKLRAHFGLQEDEENQREVGVIARFINERASRLDSRLEKYLSFIMFGVENLEDLDAEDSMLERADEMFEEITDEVRDFFDGNAEHDKNSLPGKLKAMLTSAGLALFGTRENDGQDGLISRFTENFTAGFDEFRTTLFGERAVGNARTKMSEFMNGIKEKLPRAFLSSAGSTMVKAMIAPHAGILGSFLLPGGPIGSLLLGTTTNLLHQSETFNKFMYGELGEDGERKGDGFIPKSVLDMYGKYGKTMKVGAGLGILGSLVLPGGPVTGALLGMGTSLTVKSEAFQELMFGKDFADKDNRSLKNGVFGKLFKSKGDKEFKVENPKLATFLGTAGLGVGIAQGVGLLPSMLLPGGPIIGAVLGLAGGIAASSSKFQEFLFGEKDVDGKRYGGLFTKVHNWFDTTVMGGLKLKIAELNDNVYGFLKGKIFNPIAEAFEPVKQAAIYMMDDVKEAIKGMFDKAVSPIVEAFKDYVAKPLGKALKKVVLDPIAWMLKKTFGFLGKSLLNLTTGLLMAPIKMIGGAAERFNNRHAIRDERKARRSEALENLRAGRFSVESLFGLAGVMTNEEKEQAMNERNPYRQGKSLRQRKKDHKKELKEEMQARADKRKAMQEQYEADKAFGKSHGWKYASAKQKAAREQELKEKANWLQEQQLLKAQETEEKVSATGDTVNKIATGDVERNNILKDIRNMFYKFVYGKDADYERDHAPEPYNVMNTPDQTMVDKANAVLDGTASPEIFGNNTQQKSIFSNLIDVVRSRGQSHADGLDEVPNDGYIAELHEGEMVVPKKPAGKLRGMIDKVKDSNMFSTLTSWLDKKEKEDTLDRADNDNALTELEEKQAKEKLDDERQAKVSRKSVDFIQQELLEKQEKKEEKAWRNNVLAAIANVGGTIAGAATAAADLPGLLLDGVKSLLKNLGIGGILAGIAGLLAKNQYDEYSKIAKENQASVWDVYQGDYREERKDVDGQYVYDNGLVNQVKHAWQGRNALLKPVKAAYNAGKNVFTKTKDTFVNVKNGVSKLLNPNAVDDAAKVGTNMIPDMVDDVTGEVIQQGVKNGADDFAQTAAKNHKGLFNKFIELGKKALSIIADKAEEYFPKQMGKMKINAKSITGCADDIFKKILGSVDVLFPKFGKRIGQLLANIAGDSTGVLALVTGGYDLISGLYAGNAGNLFGVPKNHVDMEMRLITSFIQVICGLSIFSVVWLINEITSSMFGLDFMQTLARAIYNALPNIGKTADFSNDLIGKDVDSMSTEQLITEAGGDWSKFEGKDLQNMSLKELQKLDPNISTAELMEIQRVDYNNKNGTKLDRLAWKDKITPTFGGKVWDSLTTTKAEREAKIAKYQEKVDNGEANWWDKMWLNRHQNKLNDEIAKNTGQAPSKLQTFANWILNPVGSLSDSLMNGMGTFLSEEKRSQWNKGLEKTKWLRNPLGAGIDWLFGKKGKDKLPPGASVDDSGNITYEGAGMGDGEVYDPKEEKLVPVYDNNGTLVSFTTKILDDVTEVKGLTAKDLSIPEVPRNTEIIPQLDQKGNVVSYTTVEKSKKQSLFGRIGSAFSSIFGGSTSNSSNVDNSSSVTNNTGDTYNTTTNEIDTTPFQPLTEAINSLVDINKTENVNEEGKAKTGNFLQAIMDPSGYLFKKLLNMGIDVKSSVTGEETDPETVNKAINIFKMLRNPLGYLYKTTKEYMEGDKETVNAVNTAKEKTKEALKNGKEWAGDKWNAAKDWGKEKIDTGKEWFDKEKQRSYETAAIMAGDKNAKANVLSTGVSNAGKLSAGIYNLFAGEGNEITSGEMTDAIATFINKAIVTPFKELANPATDKFNEVKESISDWVTEKKENISNWYTEEFKPGLEKSKEGAKKTQQAIIDDVNATKERISNWYTENIGKPLEKSTAAAKKSQQAIFDDVKARKDAIMDWVTKEFKKKVDNIKKTGEAISDWVKGFKDKIVETFNKYLKDPVSDALSPVTSAISGAWSSFKSAFEPFGKLFDAIKGGGSITDILKSYGQEGRDNAGLSGIEGSGSNRDIRPKKYRATESDFITPTTNTTNNTTNTNTNNKFVFYSQSDNRWSGKKIGNRKMKDSGCGPTSLAMAISQLTGEQITPDTIAKLGKEHIPGYSKYSLFPSVAEKLNMNYNEGYNEEFIVNNLKRGVPVILSGKTGAKGTPYTTEGHVVTATRIKGDSIFVNDPRGKEYSGYYPINAVLEGLTKGMAISPSDKTDVTGLSSGKILNGWNGNEYKDLNKEGLGIFGEVGEYRQLDDMSGRTGASQITMADRVLSYARAFLNNTSKFSYSQPRRLQIDTNKSSSKGCGADCSSFVSHVLSRAGDVDIYGTTSQTFWDSVGTKVDEPQIGDVVCQQGHVGLYSGDGNYIHMSGRKSGIKESKAIQRGNNKHRGYKRVLKNPSQLVDPTVPNPNTFLGTVVGTPSGHPVNGNGGATPTSTGTAAPAASVMGVFDKFSQIGQNLVGKIYNSDANFDMFASVPSTDTTPTDGSAPDISNIPDTAEAVWKFFTGKGYSTHATAGIMGNLQQESSMDPTKKQYGGGPGRGIGQWTVSEERFKGLEAHAKSKGKDWTDLQSQLEWIDMELNGKDPTTANKLKKNYGGIEGFKKATDTKWAVEAFEKSFERAGKPNYTNRYKYADNYFSKFASAGTGPAMATTAEAAPSGGSTPTSMNGWAYYNQNDSQWQEDISGKKIGPSGCGMASHAMMLTSMFSKQITPVTVGRWARKKGLWGDGGMAWEMSQSVADEFGMNLPLNIKQYGGATASDLQKVKDEIKAGRPVVLSGKGKSSSYETPFTGGGHIVLAVGVDGQNRLIINDPRGPERTKAYEDKGILDIGTGLRGAWSFEQTSSSKIPEGWETGGDFATTPGATPTSTGTAAPAASIMGVFDKFSQIGQNLVGKIYNSDANFDMFASVPSTDGTTPSTGQLPEGDTAVDETLMLSGQEGFFKALGPSAAAAFNQYHIFPSTTLAQAALESGWGKSRVATTDKNLFGIKWTGKYAPGITVTQGLNCPGNEQGGARPYNRYQSYSDSMVDHAWFLGKNPKRYGPTMNATTPEQQIIELGKSGYAEASTYAKSLQNMVDKYNLTRFNTATTGAGNGDGEVHWAKGFGDNQSTPKTRYSGGAGMGDGDYTRHAIKAQTTAQRDIEKTVRRINNTSVNVVPATGNQQGLSKACVELLQAMITELQAINTNTAETAKGVSEIEIVSANEPISGFNGKKQGKTTDTRHNSSDTGYNTARKIASFK